MNLTYGEIVEILSRMEYSLAACVSVARFKKCRSNC